MSLSTDQIEHQAETHRAHISELIEELRDRVTPGEVVDQFLGWDEGREIARTFGRQVRDNPLPLALIGTGVAWLMLSDGLRSRRTERYQSAEGHDDRRDLFDTASDAASGAVSGARRAAQAVSGAANYATDQASDIAGRTRDKAARVSDTAQSAAESARQTASDVADGAQSAFGKAREAVSDATVTATTAASSAWDRTTNAAQSTADTVSQAGSSLNRMAHDQPLLAAGIGLALGLALGAVLPLTETENELLGEQSEAMKQRAGELAGEGFEKAKAVAERSYEAATEAAMDEAQNQGLTAVENSSQADRSAQDGSPSQRESASNEGRPFGGSDGGDLGQSGYGHH